MVVKKKMSKLKIDITGVMDEHFKRGVGFVKINQINKALVEFKKSVEVTERVYLPYWQLGLCYNEIGKFEEAVKYFNLSIQYFPELLQTHEIYYYKALALKKLGKFDEAILDLKEVVKQDPTNADAWTLKSNCHRAIGNYEEAIKSIDKALEVGPKNLLARKNKAAIYVIQGDSEEAQKILNESLNIIPIDFQSWGIKGEQLIELGNFEEALKCFNQALSSGHPYAHQMIEKCKKGEKQYQDILKSHPQNSKEWNARGIKLHSIGVYIEALECFEEALRSEPSNYNVLMNKALALKDLARYNKTLEVLESLLREYPDDALLFQISPDIRNRSAAILNNKGMILSMLEQYKKAYRSFEKALELDPNVIGAQINKDRVAKLRFRSDKKKLIDEQTTLKKTFESSLYNFLEKQGAAFTIKALEKRLDSFIEDTKEREFGRENLEQMLNKLRTNGQINSVQHNGETHYFVPKQPPISTNPSSIRQMLQEALILFQRKEYNKCKEFLKHLLDLEPELAEGWVIMGQIELISQNYLESIEYLKKALEVNPTLEIAWSAMGNVLDQQGMYDKAIQYYDKALEINPNFAPAWNNKGLALDILQKHHEAIKCYKRSLELNPNNAGNWFNKGKTHVKVSEYQQALY